MFDAERRIDLIVTAGLFAAVRKLSIRSLRKHDLIPIDAFCEFLNFRWRHARGIHHADNATHAGSGNAVDGDVIFFQPLQHSDLGHAKRTATAESKADACAMSRLNWCGLIWRMILSRSQSIGYDKK